MTTYSSAIAELCAIGENYLRKYPEPKSYFFSRHHNQTKAKQLTTLQFVDPDTLLKHLVTKFYPRFNNTGSLLESVHDCVCRHYLDVKHASEVIKQNQQMMARLADEGSVPKWDEKTYLAAAKQGYQALSSRYFSYDDSHETLAL